jgi:hypothetical protein
MMGRLMLAAAVGAVALLAALSGTASAQYPPPTGSCSAVTSATVSVPGGMVELTVTVRDANGNPMPNAHVEVHVVRQPEGGATLDPASGTSDANGQFKTKLTLGSGSGTVEVAVDCGDVETSVSVVAGAVSEVVAPPDTGFGPIGNSHESIILWSLMLATGAAVLFLAAGAKGRRNSR